MTGALCGAVSQGALPDEWVGRLGDSALASARDIAEGLARLARGLVAERFEHARSIPGCCPATPVAWVKSKPTQ